MNKLKQYRIIYTFDHSKMGFQNSITINALNVDDAIKIAKIQVSEVYGNELLKKFSFKPGPTSCGVVL